MQIKMLAILLFCKVKCLLLIFYILCKMNALRLYIVRLQIKKDFRELFEEVFGSLKCAEIQAGRKDCLDVITGTARIVEAVIKRYGL